MIYKAVPPALQSPRNMCCWHSTRECLFLWSKGLVTGNQVGWLSCTRWKNHKRGKGGRKQVVYWSLLQQTSPCAPYSWNHELWFPVPLTLRHNHTHLPGCCCPSFLAWPPAWSKFLFLPVCWGVLVVRTWHLVFAIWTRLAVTRSKG